MREYKRPNVKVLKAKKITGNVIGTILKIAVCVIFAFPFYWMLITSFKTFVESLQFPPTLWPREFTIQAYITVFEKLELGKYIWNSIIVLVCNTALSTLLMIPAAYAFAKYEFKGKDTMFTLLMVAFMVPTCLTFITVYRMFAHMNMLNTLIPQILPCICNAFGIFLLRQSFMQIPEELIESARLDEANELQIIAKIMLPMSKSTLSTILFLSVIGTWNSYFWPLIMTISDEVRPITVAIERMKNLESGLVWPNVMAGNMILIVPILIVFIFASKKIIASMAYRGVK